MDRLKKALKGMEQFKCSPVELSQKLTKLETEYLKQREMANKKINKSTDIVHTERIIEYVNDMDSIMKLVYELKKSMEGKYKFLKMILPFHARKYKQILSLLKKMNKKYKKEDCDINNFEW